MPTYEYVCTSCGTSLEVVQSIHDRSLTQCPNCEGGRLRKVFGNVGVVFKGSGFYRTDSRGKSPATTPAAAGTEVAAAAGSSTSADAAGSKGATKPGPAAGGGGSSTPATATPAKASAPAAGS